MIDGEQDRNTTIYERNLPERLSKERQPKILQKTSSKFWLCSNFQCIPGDSKENLKILGGDPSEAIKKFGLPRITDCASKIPENNPTSTDKVRWFPKLTRKIFIFLLRSLRFRKFLASVYNSEFQFENKNGIILFLFSPYLLTVYGLSRFR